MSEKTDPVENIMRGYRGLDYAELCSSCEGWGVRTYSSTSTWRGGAGGQMMTNSVCDQCWGSDNAEWPWPSHRLMETKR